MNRGVYLEYIEFSAQLIDYLLRIKKSKTNQWWHVYM